MELAVSERVKSVDSIKVPPHSIEAEQSVLGGVMLDNNAWDLVAELLIEADFYRHEHRLIFRVMHQLSAHNTPFDVLTLSEALKKLDELANAGGDAYLFELAKNIPSVANISAYVEIVRERSVLRQLIGVANHIADTAYHTQGRNVSELLDEAETKVFNIAEQRERGGEGPKDIGTVLAATLERVEALHQAGNAITGLSTGFTDLDEKTSGLQNSDLVIIAGRPSMGKTTFAINIAENAACSSKKPILIFSLEMPSESLAMRMLSSLGRIDQHRLRSGQLDNQDFDRLASTTGLLSTTSMFIDDSPGLSPSELRARARRMVKTHGPLGLIVIDYLQLMQVPGLRENRTAEISEISRALKSLARELRVPIIALSQLNRSLEQRADRRPVMSDLRESGAIEQDADLIMFIYRDEVYHEDSPDKGTAEIIIGKQRNGPIGKVRLTFLGQFTRFENHLPEQALRYS